MTNNLTDALNLLTALAALPELTPSQILLIAVVLYVNKPNSNSLDN